MLIGPDQLLDNSLIRQGINFFKCEFYVDLFNEPGISLHVEPANPCSGRDEPSDSSYILRFIAGISELKLER